MEAMVNVAEAKARFSKVRHLRGLRIDHLLKLINVVATEQPIGYTDLFLRLSISGLTTKDGKPLANSSYYHLLSAATLLGLVTQAPGQKLYTVTDETRTFVDPLQVTAELDAEDTTLPDELKQELRHRVTNSSTLQEAFFWLFVGPGQQTSIERGSPIYISPKSGIVLTAQQGLRKSRVKHTQITSRYADPLVLDTVETQSIIFGIRRWCLKLEILDELVIAARATVPEEAVQVLFPIKDPRNELTSDHLTVLLGKYIGELANKSANYWSISIPELLYRLCPEENLAVDVVKSALQRWIQTHRGHVLTTPFSPSIAMSAWTRRAQDYNTLLKSYLPGRNGYVSHLGIIASTATSDLFPDTKVDNKS